MVALDPKEQRKIPIFLKRDTGSASSSGADCVSCGDTPECPTCKDDEQCALTTQTCNACPKTYCTQVTSTLDTKSSSLGGGAISGIAVGSLVFAVLLIGSIGYLLYTKWWVKKHPDSTFFGMRFGNEHKDDGDEDPLDGEEMGDEWEDKKKSKRLSQMSYATTSQGSVMTRASNILNVAYIPGVKIRAGRRTPHSTKAASIFSKDTLLSSIDEASVHAGQIASKGTHPQLIKINQTPTVSENKSDLNEKSKVVERGLKTNLQQEIIQEEEEEDEEEENDGKTDNDEKENNKNVIIKVKASNEPISTSTPGKVSDKINLDQTPFGALVLKKKPEPLASDSESDTDSDILDSDTESIKKINEEFQRKKEEALSRSGTTKKKGLDIPVEIVPVNAGKIEKTAESNETGGPRSNGILLELDIDDDKANEANEADDEDDEDNEDEDGKANAKKSVTKGKEEEKQTEEVGKETNKEGKDETKDETEKTQEKTTENSEEQRTEKYKLEYKSLDPFKTPFD